MYHLSQFARATPDKVAVHFQRIEVQLYDGAQQRPGNSTHPVP